MFNKNNDVKKIFSKFEEVKSLDSDYKPVKVNRLNTLTIS
jgi:hypothetical protein